MTLRLALLSLSLCMYMYNVIHMCIVYTVQSYHNILILAYNMSEVSSYISVRARVVPSNQIMRQSKRNASCGILQRLLKVVHLTRCWCSFSHVIHHHCHGHLSPIPTFPRPSLPSASSSSSMSGNKGSSCDGGGKEKATWPQQGQTKQHVHLACWNTNLVFIQKKHLYKNQRKTYQMKPHLNKTKTKKKTAAAITLIFSTQIDTK